LRDSVGFSRNAVMSMEPKRIFRIGDLVRIRSGPFTAFTGRIEGINQAKSLLKVRVEIFGRGTPVRVEFSGAEKLEFDLTQPPTSSNN
jgi:transcriptional antiterminator NusG